MRDDSEQFRQLIEHLEAAARIAEELGQSTTAYLAECALDAARAAMWPGYTPARSHPRSKS